MLPNFMVKKTLRVEVLVPQKAILMKQFPLAPMGVLAPGSAHA